MKWVGDLKQEKTSQKWQIHLNQLGIGLGCVAQKKIEH